MTSSHSDSESLLLARLLFEGGSYDGLAFGGLPHSFGALKLDDGCRFVGQWDHGYFVLGQATRSGSLKCTGEFNDQYQLHGNGSSVNFLGAVQEGHYHKDIFKTAFSLPPEHNARVGAAIAAAESKCTEAQNSMTSYCASAPKPAKCRAHAGTGSAAAMLNPNTQAQIDAAAARDAELARRVADADLTQLQSARIAELKVMVDNFTTADRRFLQLPAGMAAWERGVVHEYAASKGLHHPTTEISPGDRRITLAKPMLAQDQPCNALSSSVVRSPSFPALAEVEEAPELFMDNIFTLDVMEEPVIATDGFVYEKRCILEWFRTKRTSPTTGAVLTSTTLIPNHSLKSQINQWREAQARAGSAQPEQRPQ